MKQILQRLLLLTISLLLVTATLMAQAPLRHVVKKQETVYSISKRYGVSEEEIYRLNEGSQWGIREGQTLLIPQGKPDTIYVEAPAVAQTEPGIHVVQSGETLYRDVYKRQALHLQIAAIILKELNRKSRQGDIPLTATAHKRVKQSIGVPIIFIRPRTTAFSLGFEFFHTKSKQGRWSFPDTLQVVLQQLGTHCSILVKQDIVALFDFLPKCLQALVGLLLLCLPSLHAPIVGGSAFACGYHRARSVYGNTAKDCRCAVCFDLALIDVE